MFMAAAQRFFTRALQAGTFPVEVTTDRALAYPRVREIATETPDRHRLRIAFDQLALTIRAGGVL
jgi:hypothetical protein